MQSYNNFCKYANFLAHVRFFSYFCGLIIFCTTLNCKKYIISLCFFLLSSWLMAEVVILQTGQSVKGDIVLQNEDVVIIRTSNGMRFQYPMSEVSGITMDENETELQTEKGGNVSRKQSAVSLRLQTMSGALYMPDMGWGGYAGADLMVGANVLEGQRMFVGGGVGYRAKIVSDRICSFIPLQAAVSSIFTDQRHSPIVGIHIGYGISTNKKVQGGICAGAELGWHYLVDENTSIVLGLTAEWQQAKMDVVEAIVYPSTQEVKEYINHKGVNFITFGAKIAILF